MANWRFVTIAALPLCESPLHYAQIKKYILDLFMQLNALSTPVKQSIAIALIGGLAACTGNDSSSTFSPAPVIDPVEVDKAIGEVDWDQTNQVEMASHAYRAIARHSMLATLYSGKSAVFSTFINIVNGSRNRSCNISGSIDADLLEKQCQNASNGDVPCTAINTDNGEKEPNPDASIIISEQRAIFYSCQDGISSGAYFHGPLRVIVKDDTSVDDQFMSTTTISAVAEVSKQDEKGKFILDADNKIVKETVTDFLYQSESFAFFIGHEYNLETTYDTSADRLTSPVDLSECTVADKTVDGVVKVGTGTSIVVQEAMKTDLVAALQDSFPQSSLGPRFPYTEFTDLNLTAINSDFGCVDHNDDSNVINESLRYKTTYTLSTKIASKALGSDTQFDWAGLVIPSNQEKVDGTITLTHTNSGSTPYEVTVAFDGKGGVTVSNGANIGPSMTVQEFLDKSKAELE